MNTSELTWFKSSYSSGDGDNCIEVAWFKSSYSGSDGDNCVEVAWSKSTHSGTQGDSCVEVSTSLPESVCVRDSKDIRRPHLTLSPTAWQAFVSFASRA